MSYSKTLEEVLFLPGDQQGHGPVSGGSFSGLRDWKVGEDERVGEECVAPGEAGARPGPDYMACGSWR